MSGSKTKRRYGSGSVRKRGGTWEILYRPVPGGKQKCRRVGREEDGIGRAEAEHALNEVLVQIGRGEGQTMVGHRFGDVAKAWREQVEALNPNLSNRTLELYDVALNVHLFPAMENSYLHEIEAKHIESYVAKKLTLAPSDPGAIPVDGEVASKLDRPIGTRSIQQQLSVLHQIFRFAVRHKMLSSNLNPMLEIEINLSTKREEVKPLEQEQVRQLLMHTRNEEEETLLLLLGAMGLRIGEALALQVGDFNEKDQTLSISRTLTKIGGKTVISPNGTKTNAGQRTLNISDDMAKRIKRQIQRAEPRCKDKDVKLLFPNKKGNLFPEANFRNRIFRPALKRAGLPLSITPHSLRHTFASECIAQGLPITQISTFLGHSSNQTTMTIYAHVFERQRKAIADLADIYSHDAVGD